MKVKTALRTLLIEVLTKTTFGIAGWPGMHSKEGTTKFVFDVLYSKEATDQQIIRYLPNFLDHLAKHCRDNKEKCPKVPKEVERQRERLKQIRAEILASQSNEGPG